ncbi:hypothetical protein MN869_14795 [Acinetobacter sp. NIPH1876]|uniref:Uncharacterized protein n=1 Tax=Acinetobacter higginsii TaxID=70347 RepID=N9T480_9GAMM|nr:MULTISPECIES: hypothetical protein [Acinetobacter]ENX58185.1 hypothetical protein F902_02585 [Acinetobacter higginsii]MCJ0829714.1 hypothetical protein [Acinetobacter sp. NIPH1876]
MNKDFEWLKWVGLFFIVGILVAIAYLRQNNRTEINVNSELNQVSHNSQNLSEEEKYDEMLNQATLAIIEGEIEAKQVKDNPPVYEALSLNQTKKFIDRVEQLQATDSSVNLEYTPDVARQSRKYNALVEEAEAVYGSMDISNKYRYCTSMVSFARELWWGKYSKASTSQEYKDHAQQMFLDSYNQAKKDCIAEIKSKQ